MSSAGLVFQHIGLSGRHSGTLSLTGKGFSWTNRNNTVNEKCEKENILRICWTVFGSKAHLIIYTTDGSLVRFDGFEKTRYGEISQFIKSSLGVDVEITEAASDGSHFGEMTFNDKSLSMKSGATNKQSFEVRLDNVAQCVIPGNSRNEVEVQFLDDETGDKESDFLSQIRIYFPSEDVDEDEGEPEMTKAEEFQRAVMDKGRLRSVTGDVIVEFDKELGNFMTPRGRYAIQMYATFLRMHGEKYDYKIPYEDIDKLFLLHRPDGYTSNIVISLHKPIRQGNQRYPHLVLQSSREEYTLPVNLSKEEIAAKYDNQLEPEMTMAASSLIAKIFKVLSQSKVFVPKNFKSDRDTQAVKCSLKANDGLLFPLEKSFIFVHKPTIIIHFADIESIDFQRIFATGQSVTRNFDLKINVKASAAAGISGDGTSNIKEYVFSSIDRSEYNNLYDFLESKKLPIKEPKQAEAQAPKRLIDGPSDDDDIAGSEEDSEDDGDYEAGKSSGSSSGGESSEGDASDDDNQAKPKASKKGSSKDKSTSSKRKRKGKKDKNAPKNARSAYTYYVEANTPIVKAENPTAKLGDISKIIGAMWQKETPEAKAIFEAKAAGDKIRRETEMKSYVPPSDDEGSDGDSDGDKPKKRAKKDKNAPKGALTAYFVFSNEVRAQIKAEHPDFAVTQISKETANRWRTLTAEEKAPYEEKSKLDKERYQREQAEYKSRGGGTKEAAEESDDSNDES